MSLYNGATPGGFNQSGGGYYLVTTSIPAANILTYSGSSGSGGATTVGYFSTYTALGGGEAGASTFFLANRLIKDMGKTVVSAGRAFRKFQAVSSFALSTGGVVGAATPAPGYLTAYLEVAAPNQGGLGGVVNSIVRYA
jgi:hypothetical protein